MKQAFDRELMMRVPGSWILVLSALAALLLSSASWAQDLALTMRVVEHGQTLVEPRMRVLAGEEASMVRGGEGVAMVSIGVVVDHLDDDRARVVARIETAEQAIEPELVVRKGEWASVASDGLEFHILVEDFATTAD